MTKGLATGFLLTSCFFTVAVQARADATVFWDSDTGFSPGTVVIGPGDTVTWWNYDPYGFDTTVTFANKFSFYLADYHGQGVVFPSQAGIYAYHSNWGENGAVIVNLPPDVGITNPLNNAVMPAPANFTIQATTADTADDYVTDVQFFLGTSDSTNAIEDIYSAPFTTSVTNLVAGTYVLLAVATDSRGAQATNAITITVGGATIYLTAPRIYGGRFLFDVSGLTLGQTNVLQTSTNLLSWVPALTNIATSTQLTVTNNPVAGPHFYRMVAWP